MDWRAKVTCPTCGEIYVNWQDHQAKCRKCPRCLEFCTATPRLMASHLALCGTGRGFKCDRCLGLFKRETNFAVHRQGCQLCPRGCGRAFMSGESAHHDRNCPMNQSTNSAHLQSSTSAAASPPFPLIPSSTTRLPSLPSSTFGENETDVSEPQPQYPEPINIVAGYKSRASKAFEDAETLCLTQHRESRQNSRAKVDSFEISKYLEKCSIGKVISAMDFLQISPYERPRDTVIVCDMEQAGCIINRAPPLIPMLVVGARGTKRMTIHRLLVILGGREHLDVHDFKETVNEKSQVYVPKRMKSKKAIDVFNKRRNAQGEPVDMLNIALVKDNAVPECFANRGEYKMIDLALTDKGTPEKPALNDLDDSIGFQLLGSKGAAHLAHIDRHGSYTTALGEEGKKLWLMWPNVPLEELEGDVPDGGIAIFIDEGDMLIQPPNILNAAITLEDCLMTGTMHWHSSNLLDILRYTKAAVQRPALTNEAMARQFIPKMAILLNLWKNHPDAYPWPAREGLIEAFEILEWLKDGCDCDGHCSKTARKSPCSCLSRDRACDDRCHFADNRKPCWKYEPLNRTQSRGQVGGNKVAAKTTRKRVANEE